MSKEEMIKYITKLENLVSSISESCLCERNTYGFDYHENHPRLGKTSGRWKTPRSLIDDSIGFKWKYKDKEKPGDSWKEYNFKFLEKKDGFY